RSNPCCGAGFRSRGQGIGDRGQGTVRPAPVPRSLSPVVNVRETAVVHQPTRSEAESMWSGVLVFRDAAARRVCLLAWMAAVAVSCSGDDATNSDSDNSD